MKRWKKIALVLLILAILSQIPFAYRRYRLGRLHGAISQLNSQRVQNPSDDTFTEYVGVMHVHSFLGGHSNGTFEAIIAGAQANHLQFVVMTEHVSRDFDTSAMTLAGQHGGVLFLNGNEAGLVNGNRLLVVPGGAQVAASAGNETNEFIAEQKARKATVFVAYPQEFKSWGSSGYDGVEVYNLFTNSRRINPVVMFFDGLWSYRSYPDLLFANFYQRPSENLSLWDQAMIQGSRRVVASAGNDAHSNVGLSLNDSAGKKLLGIELDPYERSFRLVRMHVLVPKGQELSAESLQNALATGHSFIAFDIFGDASGFRFSATNAGGLKTQGDEIALEPNTRLTVNTPIVSRVVLFRNGQAMQEQGGGTHYEFEVGGRGFYRVEAYLSQLPQPIGNQPWIISNPIVVR
jgi:hypothetical protein